MVRGHPSGRAARSVPAGERRVARYACPAAEVGPSANLFGLSCASNELALQQSAWNKSKVQFECGSGVYKKSSGACASA